MHINLNPALGRGKDGAMKRIFEIEYPDSHGPEWLNEDNVQLVFNNYCKGAGVVVRELTDEMEP